MMTCVQLTFALGHPTPDSVRLRDAESVLAALNEDGAALAEFLGAVLALAAGASTLAVRVEEYGGVRARQVPCICQSQRSAFGPGRV